MSVKVLTYVLENSTRRGNDLLTLIVLADHANEQGISWPSVERLGKLIRADSRTAQRCIRRLEESGELKVRVGDGKGGANLYWITMQQNLELFPETPGDLPPGKLPGVTKEAEGGDTAMSPEPSGTVIKSKGVAGQGKPSPVTSCFQAYQQGIQKRYGATYPASASANGILSKLIARLGADPALQVTKAYLADEKPFYLTRQHALEILAKDGTGIWIRLQQATGEHRPDGCAYCPARASGTVNGIKHCRTHMNQALDRVAA